MSLAVKESQSSIPQWLKSDPYWHSALFILEKMVKKEPKFLKLTQTYVDLEERTISFESMKKGAAKWSSGEKIMISLAAHLFNERHQFNLSNLDRLDSDNTKIALEAIRIRFRG